MPNHQAEPRITLRSIRHWVENGSPFPMLTCYDATTASWLWKTGIQCLLVGDTAAQVILGYETTLMAKLPFMIEITAAVRRGAPNAFVMADMPFGSYQCGDHEAIRHAMMFLTDGAADAVKLEVSDGHQTLVKKMVEAGIPVVAHIGSRPQQVRVQGGYKAVGRTHTQANQLVQTATTMMHSGASMILVEAVPDEVTQKIVETSQTISTEIEKEIIPIIGCGGGPSAHGHVIVLHDLLGLTPWQPPFAKPIENLGERIANAASQWIATVQSKNYLKNDHPYKIDG